MAIGQIILVGTADTKAAELDFLYDILVAGGAPVRRVDVSTRPRARNYEVTPEAVADCHPDGPGAVLGLADRGVAVTAMGAAFAAYCATNQPGIAAVIGLCGGGGTSIVAAGMRALPYGVPKVLISTLASGDVAPYVDVSDIMMVPSVTDIAGLNRLSRVILSNAAQALLGMARHPATPSVDDKPAVGLSMFGVTTPSVTQTAELLRDRFDCLVFHATGTGGRAMERLAADGVLNGMIDTTLTEVADLLVGGVLPAGQDRLDVVAQTRLPWVGSLGALDMVNFWAPDTVPDRFADRLFYHHNPNVTLMRTTPSECARIGAWIATKLNACDGPVRLLIPLGGVSALDTPDGPFRDPAASDALIAALRDTLRQTVARQIIETPHHINDPAFSALAAETFTAIAKD